MATLPEPKDKQGLISWLAQSVIDYYTDLYKKNIQPLVECPEPGQKYGWKIDSKGIRFVGCACYTEAVWPSVLTLGVGPLLRNTAKNVGEVLGEQITKNIVKKGSSQLSEITSKVSTSIAQTINNIISARSIFKKQFQRNSIDSIPPSFISEFPGFEWERPLEVARTLVIDYIAELQRKVTSIVTETRSLAKAEEFVTSASYRTQIIDQLQNQINDLDLILENTLNNSKALSELDISPGGKDFIKSWVEEQIKTGIQESNLDEIKESVKNIVETQIINQNSQLGNTLQLFSGILSFVGGVLLYATIVTDKECAPLLIDDNVRGTSTGPFDSSIAGIGNMGDRLAQIIDSVYFGGQWRGSKWDGSIFYPVIRNINGCKLDPSLAEQLGPEPSWDRIKEVLISRQLPVWPERNAKCQCVDCPSGYKLCSYESIINGWSDVYNICLPVCGGQDIYPLQLEGVVTKSNCKVDCPQGFEWMSCDDSNCDKNPCPETRDRGFCVKTPWIWEKLRNNFIDVKYAPIIWDSLECRWVCASGRWVMDIANSIYFNDPTLTGVKTVYVDDPIFDEKIIVNTGGVIGYIPKYKFEPDRYERYDEVGDECPVNSGSDVMWERLPLNDCLYCSSGSIFDLYDNYGAPTVPPGYVLFDNNVISIVE